MRIYDTFPFDGELDLLEHRLRENFDLVDFFVLVESSETFRGDAKPLHFREARERFSWAASKLRPIALPRRPGKSPWERENFTRDAVMLGLLDAAPDDMVLLLDADEIVSRSLLERLRSEPLDAPHRLTMTRHAVRFDLLAPRSTCCPSHVDPFPFAVDHVKPESWDQLSAIWMGNSGVAARFRDLAGDAASVLPARSPNELREAVFMPRLGDAGRHLTTIESSEALARKLSHLPHTEHAGARALSPVHQLRAKRYGLHHRGWWYAERPAGPLPADLERLRERLAAAQATAEIEAGALPPRLLRHAARSWFWIREDARLSDASVARIDRHFEALLPLLLLPLLAADVARHLVAHWQSSRPEMRFQASQPMLSPHW